MKVARVNGPSVVVSASPYGLGGATDVPFLGDLADVDVTGLVDGQVLVWDDATSTWVPGSGGTGGLPWFDVTVYGAVGDGTTDDTTAIDAAIAALNTATKGVLYFPAGTYKVTAALTTITATGTVLGDGIEASKISQTSTTAYTLTTSAHGVTFRGLWLTNARTGTPSAGGSIKVTGGNLGRIEDVLINNCYIGIDHQAGTGWVISGVFIENCDKYGIKVSNAANPDFGDWVITESYLSDGLRSSDAAIRVESSGGGKISDVKVNGDPSTGFNHGIDLAVASAVNTVDLQVANCSIENVRGNGINGTTASGATWAGIVITGCEIALNSNNSGRAVSFVATNADEFSEIVIATSAFSTDGTARAAISLTKCDNVTLSALNLSGFNAYYTSSSTTNVNDLTVTGSTSFTTPAIVLGTAAAAGAASTAIRSDSTIAAFDATVPVTQAFSDAAATGSAAFAARRDHRHGMPASPTVTAGVLLIADTHSTPIVFADVILNEATDDFLYSD